MNSATGVGVKNWPSSCLLSENPGSGRRVVAVTVVDAPAAERNVSCQHEQDSTPEQSREHPPPYPASRSTHASSKSSFCGGGLAHCGRSWRCRRHCDVRLTRSHARRVFAVCSCSRGFTSAARPAVLSAGSVRGCRFDTTVSHSAFVRLGRRSGSRRRGMGMSDRPGFSSTR